MNRRHFFNRAATAGMSAVAAASVSRVAMAALPEPATMAHANTAAPLAPPNGRPYNPVVTLNGWSLPWRMNAGVKEFHLVAEPVLREMAPGFTARLWGYNGQSPGPTIEVVEGDRLRAVRHQPAAGAHLHALARPAPAQWHGRRGGPDAAGHSPGQDFRVRIRGEPRGHLHVPPARRRDDADGDGNDGLLGDAPEEKPSPSSRAVDRDFVFLLNAYDIAPGAAVPKTSTMADFNIWTWNSRVFPGIASLPVRLGDRVRIRVGNLSMTNHPMHLHGHSIEVTGTDGGPRPKGARWPEVSTDIAVGQMRQMEFSADEEGDWAFHCHKAHHTMNAMGHDVPNMLGVDQRDIADRIERLVPGYMPMGGNGMADMTDMPMPLPANTAPMMGWQGPVRIDRRWGACSAW
jgi:FtsP/CotA-like multicopper oxidase with cupredoxin domain